MAEQGEEQGGSGAKIVGGVVGGAGVGYATFSHLANKTLRNSHDLDVAGSEINKKVGALAAKSHGGDREKAIEALGLKKVNDRLNALEKDGTKLTDALAKNSKLSTLGAKAKAFDLFGKPNALTDVSFEKVGDTYTISAKLGSDHGLADHVVEHLGAKDGKVFKLEGLASLPPMGATGELHAGEWAAEAKQAFKAANAETFEKESIRAIRKAGGIGWSFGNLSGKGKLGVGAMVVGGVAVGATVFHALFGGKHTSKVTQEQQPDISQARG